MINGLVLNLFLDLSLIAVPIAFLVSKERSLKKTMKWLGFKQINGWELLKKTLKLFLALLAVSIWLSIALNVLGLNDLQLVAESLEKSRALLPLFFWIVVLRVISEEVFFRGFLVGKIGAVASSGVFALFHLGYGSTTEVLGAFVLGLVLAKAFQLNKNLYPNIAAHMVYNAIALGAILA